MKKFVILAALALSPYFLAQDIISKPVQSYQSSNYQSKKKAFIDNLISKMTLDEKNRVSHRGNALRNFKQKLLSGNKEE